MLVGWFSASLGLDLVGPWPEVGQLDFLFEVLLLVVGYVFQFLVVVVVFWWWCFVVVVFVVVVVIFVTL